METLPLLGDGLDAELLNHFALIFNMINNLSDYDNLKSVPSKDYMEYLTTRVSSWQTDSLFMANPVLYSSTGPADPALTYKFVPSSLGTPEKVTNYGCSNISSVAVQDKIVDDKVKRFSEKNTSSAGRKNFPQWISDTLVTWLDGHLRNPFPTTSEKELLAEKTGLSLRQVSDWFINARRRRIKALQG